MASNKTDGDAPKTGGKKWDGNAERDLCLALILGEGSDGEKNRPDWNVTHQVMLQLGYDFTKDAMSQRWSKTIMKEFRARHGGTVAITTTTTPKKTPTKRKKATPAAALPAEAAETAEENGEETSSVAGTPPATPTTKPRKRTPAKPKATTTTPSKPRGRKAAKSAEKVDPEADADMATEVTGPVKKEAEDEIKAEADEADEGTPSKRSKIVANEDTDMMDEV